MSNQIRQPRVSSGNQFMKGTSINFLRKVCKTERNAKAKIRLKAAILRKQDMTYSQICLSLDLVLSTLILCNKNSSPCFKPYSHVL